MSIKLRELIRQVRACKTAAEERAVVAKEGALIRTAFKEEDTTYRHRNVAKVMYIHMLGYPSHFGQMECLKLIAGATFTEKRIGYLGLMLLLDENAEVLMLVTNSLKSDLHHPNQYVVGLALASLGNICSPDMARDLAPEIETLLKNSNPYTRKKAALCALRIAQKVPELMEDFVEPAATLLNDRNHGVLLTGAALLTHLAGHSRKNARKLRRFVPKVVHLLKSLIFSGYSPEHDVGNITDPFLQGQLLRLLRVLGTGDEGAAADMTDVLAHVATNTDGSKNVGNSILYECVNTIIAVAKQGALRTMAINILGRFLAKADNNIRYVALQSLGRVVATDRAAVNRHRNTIVDCLKDPDISIRRRALELIYAIVNETNIRSLAREMLNYLVVTDSEFKSDLCTKIAYVVGKYAPSRKYHVETLITMFSIAGNDVKPEIIAHLVHLISKSTELHVYLVHKLFAMLRDDTSQRALITVAVWSIGELGEHLRHLPPPESGATEALTDKDIVDMLEKIAVLHNADDMIRSMLLTTSLKLSTRLGDPQQLERLRQLAARYHSALDVELQQRSIEYSALLRDSFSHMRPELAGRIPVLEDSVIQARMEAANDVRDVAEGTGFGMKGTGAGEEDESTEDDDSDEDDEDDDEDSDDDEDDDEDSDSDEAVGPAPVSAPAPAASGEPDLLDIFGAATAPAPSQPASSLDDIFGSVAPSSTPAPAPAVGGGLDDLLGGGAPAPAPAAPAPAGGQQFQPFVVFNKHGVTITFHARKPVAGSPHLTQIDAHTVSTNGAGPVTGYAMQAAVPKFIKMQLGAVSGTTLSPGGAPVTQSIKLSNSQHGQKALAMRLKVAFTLPDGTPVNEITTVNNFPQGL